MKRREFLKDTMIASAGFTILPSKTIFSGNAQKVRLGIIGTGLRGQNHLENALRRTDVEITAICDVDDRMLQSALQLIKQSGKQKPQVFTGDNYAYRKLLAIKPDAIIIATPWEWHTPMILDALD